MKFTNKPHNFQNQSKKYRRATCNFIYEKLAEKNYHQKHIKHFTLLWGQNLKYHNLTTNNFETASLMCFFSVSFLDNQKQRLNCFHTFFFETMTSKIKKFGIQPIKIVLLSLTKRGYKKLATKKRREAQLLFYGIGSLSNQMKVTNFIGNKRWMAEISSRCLRNLKMALWGLHNYIRIGNHEICHTVGRE